jgi:hypothetical protein
MTIVHVTNDEVVCNNVMHLDYSWLHISGHRTFFCTSLMMGKVKRKREM